MFESIILVGPGTNLFPVTNSSLKITNLPILNTELLLINIKLLQPVSNKIYIVILQTDIKYITHLINLVDVPLEIIGIDCYDGTVQQLIKLKNMIKTDYIIVTKGDLICTCDMRTITDDFLSKKTQLMTVLNKGDNGATIGIRNQEMIFYTKQVNFVLPTEIFLGDKITITKEYDTVQLFLFDKDIYSLIDPDMFSLKNNFLPKIVERLRNICPVRLFDPMSTYIEQVRDPITFIDVNRYLKQKIYSDDNLIYTKSNLKIIKQYIKKNKIEDIKNILEDDLEVQDAIIVDSIIGPSCDIRTDSQIFSSIIMNNVLIGYNCHIENCVIGNNVKIPDNSYLVRCTVSPRYVFTKSENSKDSKFSCY